VKGGRLDVNVSGRGCVLLRSQGIRAKPHGHARHHHADVRSHGSTLATAFAENVIRL